MLARQEQSAPSVSLLRFLTTGEIGNIHVGLTEAEIRQALGTPDAEGVTSRKYKRSACLKYGTMEFLFTRDPVPICGIISVKASRDGFQFPRGWTVADWAISSEWREADVAAYLTLHEIGLTRTEIAAGIPTFIVPASGASITFDEELIIDSVSIAVYKSASVGPGASG
jgi:hypothetical protein